MKHYLYGVSGVARSGKDTFGLYFKKLLESKGQSVELLSFAKSLKADIDPFLTEKVGISAFTQDTEEKSIIRPLLVAYGMTMRTIDENYWIKKTSKSLIENMSRNVVSIITDVRFPNEIKFIKTHTNACVIHLSRLLNNALIPPANEEEAQHDPLCIELSDVQIEWPTFGDTDEEYTSFIESNVFPKILSLL